MTATTTPALALQQHLRRVIDAAKELKLCPPGWGSHWGEAFCAMLLEQRTLEQWLKVTPEMIGVSRGVYYPLKRAGKAKQGWKPFYVAESEVDEDEWEQQKQAEETRLAQEQQQELTRQVNGTETGDRR